MYKGTITSSTAYTAGTNIPFTAQINSNSATTTGSGTVTLLKAGYYNIFANINATGTAAGNVTAGHRKRNRAGKQCTDADQRSDN